MATETKVNNQPMAITMDQLREHEADMARRRKEHQAKEETLLRCCDPMVAMEYELKKPQYKYTVECVWWAHSTEPRTKNKRGPMEVYDDEVADHRGGRLIERKERRTVVAQDEMSAWALFCDAIQTWPSPKLPGMKRSFKRSKEPVSSELVMSLINSSNRLGN